MRVNVFYPSFFCGGIIRIHSAFARLFNEKIFLCLVVMIWAGCSDPVRIKSELGEAPAIFPDYAGVTIPQNIAPLNFELTTHDYEASCLLLEAGGETVEVKGRNGSFQIPEKAWRNMLKKSVGKDIQVVVCVKKQGKWLSFIPFRWHVVSEPVDPYLAYRLIEPGYALWNEMGIYQRQMESFTQHTVIENKMTGGNCMNCHSFCNQEPDKMLFHMRKTYPGTYMIDGEMIEKLNTKTDRTISALVYPSWHPSGKFVAFTVNDTRQAFHANDPNRIEVFDMASDVVVYDVEKKELITVPGLFSKQCFETFPTFSPDGRTLYFCTANAQTFPDDFEKVKYSLCTISFDSERRTFGTSVDTLYHAGEMDKSVSLPRVSPDGKFLLYTLSDYGNFFIWHQDADLYMMNLETKEQYPLTEANSDFAESYHSWSSNSRWIVFSSRRMDGLYTRPYFSYIHEDGKASKPFVLPQKKTDFYRTLMKSYNIPEFIKGKIRMPEHEIVDIARNDPGVSVDFVEEKKYPVTKAVENMAH